MSSPKIPQLDEPSMKILEDILKTTRSTGEGVDTVYYRAQHEDQLDLLDKLERTGLLQKISGQYWLGLPGLLHVNDAESKVLIQNCEKIFLILRNHYKSKPKDQMMVVDLARLSNLTFKEAAACAGYIVQAPGVYSHTTLFNNPTDAFIHPSEEILKYKNFQEVVAQVTQWQIQREAQFSDSSFPFAFSQISPPSKKRQSKEKMTDVKFVLSDVGDIWDEIENDYEVSKIAFGKKIKFVTDPFKRTVLFRDIAQAYLLANAGFSKPAVILAGSVIEELLRLFLESQNINPTTKTFDGYIKTCADRGLLKAAIHRLTDSVRHFRNLVHLANEITSKHTISKTTAIGAVSSIFTIANDFEQETKKN